MEHSALQELEEALKYIEERRDTTKYLRYTPYPKQLEFHNLIARERLLIAGNQLGKGLLHGTLVATSLGYKPVEDIKPGDTVFALTGEPTTVTGVYPQGTKKVYKLTFDQGETVTVDGDHLWIYTSPKNRYPYAFYRGEKHVNHSYGRLDVSRTEDILEQYGSNPTTARRISIPAAEPWEMEEQYVPIDPYILGLLLGDGHFNTSIYMSSADEEIVSAFGGAAILRNGKYDYRIDMPGLKEAIAFLGLEGTRSHTKFVPFEYLVNSADVRLAILQGLMDTDGTVSREKGMIHFCSVSEQLSQDVLYLVQSLGGKGKITPKIKHYTYNGERKQGKIAYEVSIKVNFVPFRLQRKVDRCLNIRNTRDRILHSIEDAGYGETTCISVAHPTSTYIIEHGIVTHNTHSAGMEAAFHSTGYYPDWWKGHKFIKPTAGWVAGVSLEGVRDGAQRILLGHVGQEGTGAIPKARIIQIARKQNNTVDFIRVRWGDINGNKESFISFKSYDQGREKFQAASLDWAWFDEEPPYDIYSEGVTRTNATKGIVFMTFTPLSGVTEVVRRFLHEHSPDRRYVNMSIEDAPHISEEERAKIIAQYKPHEIEARVRGLPVLGSGAVYPIEESLYTIDPFSVPRHWPRLGAMDFGWDHPFSAVELSYDRDRDTIYLERTYRVSKRTPMEHCGTLRLWGNLPWAWPRDGLNTEKSTGEVLQKQYRKHGLNMLDIHACFPDGSVSVETGLFEILQRKQSGRFKVFSTCAEYFEEARLYHRKDGKIVKTKDDIMDATRYGVMMIRRARVIDEDARHDMFGKRADYALGHGEVQL